MLWKTMASDLFMVFSFSFFLFWWKSNSGLLWVRTDLAPSCNFTAVFLFTSCTLLFTFREEYGMLNWRTEYVCSVYYTREYNINLCSMCNATRNIAFMIQPSCAFSLKQALGNTKGSDGSDLKRQGMKKISLQWCFQNSRNKTMYPTEFWKHCLYLQGLNSQHNILS